MPTTSVHITIGPARRKAMEKALAELKTSFDYASQDIIPEDKDTSFMAPEVIQASERAKAYIETYSEIHQLLEVMLSNDTVTVEDDRVPQIAEV